MYSSRLESILNMTPREASEYLAVEDNYNQFVENSELIGITTLNDFTRIYYGIRNENTLTRIIFKWSNDKWVVESKIKG